MRDLELVQWICKYASDVVNMLQVSMPIGIISVFGGNSLQHSKSTECQYSLIIPKDNEF